MPVQVGQPISALQGVQAQNVVLDPQKFYPATRRLTFPMKPVGAFAGYGSTDSTQLKQTGIISALDIRIAGTLVFGGTITGTTLSYRYPYALPKAIKVSANGQANLVNVNGTFLKALQFSGPALNDRGVSHSFGAVTGVNQGTLSLASDDWGTSGANQLGPGVTVPAVGTYTVDLNFRVPVAFDQRTLLGAVFAQTAQTNLTCDVEYETQANLVTLGGAATLATTLTAEISGIVYTIPQVGGSFVVPDLSAFHQFVQSRTTALAQGDNEILLPGTGIGRQLMRAFFMTSTGTAPGTPLALNATNYGQVGWRYGGNDTPEIYRNGQVLRAINEHQLGCDFGRNWGIGVHDFASDWALRDAVDEGSTSDLRLLANLVASPTTPAFEFAQQTVFAAPVGA
ncbi:MAG TPA: hypothetical protein VK659_10255 [Asanoa sp.]|nr:hypothetical protein [Asanoa sp.]